MTSWLVSLAGSPIGEAPELCCTLTLLDLMLRIDSKIDRVINCKPAGRIRKLTVEGRHSSSVMNKPTLLSSRKITIEKQYRMLQPQSILFVPCFADARS